MEKCPSYRGVRLTIVRLIEVLLWETHLRSAGTWESVRLRETSILWDVRLEVSLYGIYKLQNKKCLKCEYQPYILVQRWYSCTKHTKAFPYPKSDWEKDSCIYRLERFSKIHYQGQTISSNMHWHKKWRKIKYILNTINKKNKFAT